MLKLIQLLQIGAVMKFSKLGLVVAILAHGACIASAADSLSEAFGSGN